MSELTIQVKAATEQATKAFQEMGSKIENLSKKAEEFSSAGKISMGSFIGTLTGQAAIQGINFVKDNIIGFFKESIKAASEAETGLNDFNTALAQNANYSKDASEKFQKFATHIQETTKFEDDAVIKSGALLESLTGLSEEGLEKATSAAIDLAARFHKDLPEAMEIIGRAFNGQTRELDRLGITYEKTGDTTKDFDTLLKTIQGRFGGTAQAEVKSYAGSVEQLKNAFGNFQEAIGKSFTQSGNTTTIIGGLTKAFQGLADIIEKTGELTQKTGSAFAAYGGGVGFGSSFVAFDQKQKTGPNAEKAKVSEKDKQLQDAQDIALENELLGFERKTKADIEAQQKRVEEAKKTADAIKKIETDVQQFGLQGTERVEEERKRKVEELVTAYGGIKKVNQLNIDDYMQFIDTKEKIDQEYANKKQDLIRKEDDAVKKNQEAAIKQQKDAAEKLKTGQAAGLKAGLFGEVDRSGFTSGGDLKKFDNQVTAGRVGAVAGDVLSGGGSTVLVEGIKGLVGKIPVIGQALGPVIDALSKGPDAVKSFIRDFVKSVPILITNLVEAIPAVFEALVEQIPVLLDSLVASLPRLINALIEKLPLVVNSLAMQMPFIAFDFITSLVKNVPYLIETIAVGIYNAIVGLFNQVFGGVGDAVSGIGDFFGFAEGGYVKKVPGGYPNDSFPARLTEGELVIDQSNASKLEKFLNNQSSDTGVLNAILNAVSAPITVNSEVQVNQQTFANIILELNRQNRRLA